MNKRCKITINTSFAGNYEIEETVKQGTTYGSTMRYVTIAWVNHIGEKASCKYRDTYTEIPVFMDDISAIGDAEEIRKGMKIYRKMETLKKFEYGLKKTRIMVVRTRKEEVERIDKRVQQSPVLETDRYK